MRSADVAGRLRAARRQGVPPAGSALVGTLLVGTLLVGTLPAGLLGRATGPGHSSGAARAGDPAGALARPLDHARRAVRHRAGAARHRRRPSTLAPGHDGRQDRRRRTRGLVGGASAGPSGSTHRRGARGRAHRAGAAAPGRHAAAGPRTTAGRLAIGKPVTRRLATGDMTPGNPATGNLATGNPATGNLATGNAAPGGLSTGPDTGNWATGRRTARDPATRRRTAGDLAARRRTLALRDRAGAVAGLGDAVPPGSLAGPARAAAVRFDLRELAAGVPAARRRPADRPG
ncbi:hypothetical protein AB0M20_44630, partial [Actinoplanes sp. NPDC051633]